ncbi:MAG TPA: carboxypeptidase-like regulatory domain-containing protein [Terriglobales bacterium]|nr:carboxypeptidase-like regulatory domain-containing protein [Terriglobales bacterium]
MKRLYIDLGAALAVALLLSALASGQNIQAASRTATIMGTVTDVNGNVIPNATVVLKEVESNDPRTIVTTGAGMFEFHNVTPGITYQLRIGAKDFADWVSPPITLNPDQFKIVTGIQLRIATERTTVDVHYDPAEVATEQFKAEEKQRVFGIVPNFYVSYESDPAPLTTGMKFKLALKVSTDPVTAAGVFLVASAKQAGNTPNYGQGWGAYGKRFGAVATDGFSDIMIGGAILPSLLHQDPRYFYQGTGTTGSRFRHAVFSTFVARADNGESQPNYSSLGGVLASSSLANLYYPRSNRGAGLVFGNFAIGIAERIGASVVQEFLLGKFTRRGDHMK